MPLLSSPVAYHPSSSPPVLLEKRKASHHPSRPSDSKRRLLEGEGEAAKRRPLFRTLNLDTSIRPVEKVRSHAPLASIIRGPFIDDDKDDDYKHEQQESIHNQVMLDVLERFSPPIPDPTIAPMASTCQQPKTDIGDVPRVRTSSGKAFRITTKNLQTSIPYEQIIASKSNTAPGKAVKSFYGVDIHHLIDQSAKEPRTINGTHIPHSFFPRPSTEISMPTKILRKGQTLLWTEKYRARKFTDLVGDERIHRDVLRWLKDWDPVVFPGSSKVKPRSRFVGDDAEPRQHRKILLLTGPPGLGKTTLAHVCARQAGYEVVEINASDERSRDVVRGRIKDCVGTENVRGINTKGEGGIARKAGRPVCVIVDEVDGVVGGSSGGGEGGFMKALIDLAILDQKNSNVLGAVSANAAQSKKKRDRFRLLRPMILICNDIYHPALRPLRSSTMAEIVHIRKPPLDKIVARLKSVFDREGIACDGDGVRRLCEATWGISSKRESRSSSSGTGEGDMRGILVVGEWVAAKMRASAGGTSRLTKRWVEEHMIEDLSHGGGAARGLGRGGAKEAVQRIFQEGAGFPKADSVPIAEDFGKIRERDAVGVSELAKRAAMDRLREMVDTCGESDRIMIDCFAAYPTHPWQDDTLLSKPTAAYEWLHFHDRISSKVHLGHEWELGPYLSQSVLGFHHLFASPAKHSWSNDQKRWDEKEEEQDPSPFSGLRADWSALEVMKQNKAILQGLQSSFSTPLYRAFKSAEDISAELLPHLLRMLTPDVKPVIVGGSGDQKGIASVRKEGEREMMQHAVNVMGDVGVTFERAKVESSQMGVSSYVYRMEP